MKKVSDLIAKKHGTSVEIFDGDKKIGEVSPSTYGLGTPTGEWTYTIPEYRLGKRFNSAGTTEAMLDYTNWHAGKNWREAATKLAHKLGYKD